MLTLIMHYSAGVKINLISRGNRSPYFGPHRADCHLIATVRTMAKFANILSALGESNPSLGRDTQTHKSIYMIRVISPGPERSRAGLSRTAPRVRHGREPGPGPELAQARSRCGWGWPPARPLIHSSPDSPAGPCHPLLHRPPR